MKRVVRHVVKGCDEIRAATRVSAKRLLRFARESHARNRRKHANTFQRYRRGIGNGVLFRIVLFMRRELYETLRRQCTPLIAFVFSNFLSFVNF